MNSIYSIYKSTSKTTGKSYIGFDSKWPSRKSDHKMHINHKDFKFYRALRKYGWEDFEWTLLYQSTDRHHTLYEMETYFITEYDSFNNGYNMTMGGEGTILCEESLNKIRIANTGRKVSAETKEKLRQHNLGKKQSNETKEKNRQSNMGRKLSKESIEKIRQANTGKKHTEETKLKLSKSHKGKKLSPEVIEKMKISRTGLKQNIVTCPHCNKSGGHKTMPRWHFDNCKLKVHNAKH